ncbi:MAG: DUF998 domain-containing protein [Thermoproteota archaeon]
MDLALIGFFPENAGSIHTFISMAFFTMLIVTMFTYSFCSRFLNSPRMGLVTLVLGIASLIIWILRWPWRGVTIQETVASLMSTIWLILTIRSL